MKVRFTLSLVLLFVFVLAACTPAATPVPATEAAATEVPTEATAPVEPVTLKIAVLPIIDTLPMYVAEQEGLFAKYGVNVEFVPVASAPERDQVIAAGQADGMLTDALSVIMFNREKVQVQIVRYALTASENEGNFSILASQQSGITTPEQLKGVEIGVSQGTVIEYLTERILQAEGLQADEIKTIAVPKIPDRMALLASGELKAAVLPEPLASLAVQQGAVVVIDNSKYPQYGASVYAFNKSVIDAHPEAIRGFVAAVDEAVALLKADSSKYSTLLADKKLVPEPLIGIYQVPPFPMGIFSAEEWSDTLAWAQSKGMISVDLPYEESVNASFLK